MSAVLVELLDLLYEESTLDLNLIFVTERTNTGHTWEKARFSSEYQFIIMADTIHLGVFTPFKAVSLSEYYIFLGDAKAQTSRGERLCCYF